MAWNSNSFPTSMKLLPPLVREKAIEIACALLAQGMAQGRAIRIAIAKAKQWAEGGGRADRIAASPASRLGDDARRETDQPLPWVKRILASQAWACAGLPAGGRA
jgi:uncharacterized protein YoaH (UPF0181 family)